MSPCANLWMFAQMKRSRRLAIEYRTEWAELNHVFTRLVSFANTFSGLNKKSASTKRALRQLEQLIIMTNIRRMHTF